MQAHPQMLSTNQTLTVFDGQQTTDDSNQLVSPTSQALQDWTTSVILGSNSSPYGVGPLPPNNDHQQQLQHQQHTFESVSSEPSTFYDPSQEDHYNGGAYQASSSTPDPQIPSFSIAATSPRAGAAVDFPGNYRDRSFSDVSATSPFASPLLDAQASPRGHLHDRSSSFGSDFGATSPPTLFPNNDSSSTGSGWLQTMPPVDRMTIRDSSLQTSVFDEDADSPHSQHVHSAPSHTSNFDGIIPMLSVSDADRAAVASSNLERHNGAGIYSPGGVHVQEPAMMETSSDSYAALAGPPAPNARFSERSLISPDRSDSYDQFRQFLAPGLESHLRRKPPQRKRSLSDTGPRLLSSTAIFEDGGDNLNAMDLSSLDFESYLHHGAMKSDPESLEQHNMFAMPLELDAGGSHGDLTQTDEVPSNSRIAYSVAHEHAPRRPSQVGSIPPYAATSSDSVSSWRFPNSGTLGAHEDHATSSLRRSHSARAAGGRHRGIRSEDLGNMSGFTPDFLSSITAPDGGLAPPLMNGNISSVQSQSPSMGPAVPSSLGGGHGRGASISSSASTGSRSHPYRHDRHPSFGSAASIESFEAGSPNSAASPLNAFNPSTLHRSASERRRAAAESYSQTSAPGYGDVMGPASGASQGLSRMEEEAMLTNPVNATISTPAAQLASASRRKTDALFHCKVPGCNSTFTRQYNLRGHERSHRDERPFACEWEGCDKSFARSHDCKRHYALHLNLRPHMCEKCGQTFTRPDGLYKHQKKDAETCSAQAARGGYVAGDTSLSRNSSRSTRSAASDNGTDASGDEVGPSQENKSSAASPGDHFGGHVL